MSNRQDDDRLSRARHARQIISGSDVPLPSTRTNVYAAANGLFTQSQRTYLISLGILLVIGLALWLVFSMGVASIIFFLLALTLVAGWLVF